MLKNMLKNVKEKCPLIQNITNYVTTNDCANITLACGGSPVMADDINEVEDFAKICDGLNINIGTMGIIVPAMFVAGKKHNEYNHPIVLDPVGAGASKLRTETCQKLLDEIHFTTIRGNISEIKTLVNGNGTTQGVDANVEDEVTINNLDKAVDFAKNFAKKTRSIIAITGAIDIVADSNKAYCIFNGKPMMSKVTGTGCMLSSLTACYIAANPDNPLEATAAAVCAMGLCGEIAYNRLTKLDGNSTYRNYIIDAMFNLTGEQLEEGAKYEIR